MYKNYIIKDKELSLNILDCEKYIRLMLYSKKQSNHNGRYYHVLTLNLYVPKDDWKRNDKNYKLNILKNLIENLNEGILDGTFKKGKSYQRKFSETWWEQLPDLY